MLGELTPAQVVAGFATEAIYQDAQDQVMGARFRDQASGLILDLLQIDTAPQAFIWVNTVPVSDRGEPHTLEHLLLGKGIQGKYVSNLEAMSLGSSSAYTMQLRTCYNFNAPVGENEFFKLLEAKLTAMLHPNFTDEEIRREVCNMGVFADDDGMLRLEEKGTVYTEMISSSESAWYHVSNELSQLMYGPDHPLSYVSGGDPPAIREMVPEHIREFHGSTHHLNNMGIIMVLPSNIQWDIMLERVSVMLSSLEPDAHPVAHPEDFVHRLPPPVSTEAGTKRLAYFPHNNPAEPGLMLMAWPPTLTVKKEDILLFELFTQNLAGGPTSLLYQKLINRENRQLDIGGTYIFTWFESTPGTPIYIGISNVDPDAADLQTMGQVQNIIIKEIAEIASYPNGSPELTEFNQQAADYLSQRQRDYRAFLDSPPRFGYRHTSSGWMRMLSELHRQGGFERSLVFGELVEKTKQSLEQSDNIWTHLLDEWGLLSRLPYVVAGIADTEYQNREAQALQQRLDQYTQGLTDLYEVTDPNMALARYKEEYDARTRDLEALDRQVEMPAFLQHPPLTFDEPLEYELGTLPGDGPFMRGEFPHMTSAYAGLALDLHAIPEQLLPYLSMLPTMMTEVGVIRDGEPLSYEAMIQAQRREILYVSAGFDANPRSGRMELALETAGSDLEEALLGVDWLEMVLTTPYLSLENLDRIQEAVSQRLQGQRNVMQRSEESWVDNPADAYRWQDDHLYLATQSTFSRTYFTQRIKWQLMEPLLPADMAAVTKFFNQLSSLPYSAEEWQIQLTELVEILAALDLERLSDQPLHLAISPLLKEALQQPLGDVINDLQQLLEDIHPADLSWRLPELCAQLLEDWQQDPQNVLEQFFLILDVLRNQHAVRGYVVANNENLPPLEQRIADLVDAFYTDVQYPAALAEYPVIHQNLWKRKISPRPPYILGLLNPNASTGVHINSCPGIRLEETDPDNLADYLTGQLFSGGGPHSLFMKTWGAGLAYSNGFRANAIDGTFNYYAERCPALEQTMDFVVSEINSAPLDSSLVDYVIAQAFRTNRAGDRYESRIQAQAADLTDGVTPELVAQFRRNIMSMRDYPDLIKEIYQRVPEVYGKVMPGLDTEALHKGNSTLFLIGPEAQLAGYDDYLDKTASAGPIIRLYPADFWF